MSVAEIKRARVAQEEQLKPKIREYQIGDELAFKVKTIHADGEVASFPQAIKIANISGGGFFGKVLIPQEGNFVVKTSRPDSFHELMRSFDWGFMPFPAQTLESGAALEHLSSKLIHKVLPVLTHGKFSSPDSFGYTQLPDGYAQIVEKVKGRGPRFDLAEDEFLKFKEAQKELTEMGLKLGLEQAGQIHPDNPFGMANLWYDDGNKQWIWLDTIPAILHNMPLLYKFHKQIRHWFNQKEPTFNRIHTGYFLTEVAKNRHLFSNEQFEEIKSLLVLYDRTWERFKEDQAHQKRDLKPAVKAAVEVAPKVALAVALAPPKKIVGGVIYSARITLDGKFRKREVLKGANHARELNLITEAEWREAVEAIENPNISKKDKAVIGTLLTYYGITYMLMKAAELSGYAKAGIEQNLPLGVASLVGGIVVPPLVRYLGTRGIGVVTGTDLSAAKIFSMIPAAGNLLPVPAQMAYLSGSKSKILWHYYVRNIIAGLSSIKPEGGWSTELEAKLWQKIGAHIEKMTEFKNKEPFYEPIGERIGGDLHGNVYDLDENWVVKNLRIPWRLAGNWRGKLRENLVSDYRLLKEYLGDFIPQTNIVEGKDKAEKDTLLFVQRKINGRPLREVSFEEIVKSKKIVAQLNVFKWAVSKMFKETGRTPDIHGSNKDQYKFALTKNIIVDMKNERVWFVDTDIMGPFFSLNNPLGKVHMAKMMDGLNELTARLNREHLNL